jgi:radical SAM protein with 4Fe4S-binding SPASM domain
MDVEVAKRAITQLAEVGISGLWLYNIGESLLHPDFFEILSYCRKFDTLGTIWLSTNGEIMSSSMRGKILENPVDILNYSVNAMSIEGYKQIAPTLRFEKVHKNLKALVSERINMGSSYPILRAQMIEIPAVKNEIESFKLEYGKLVDILSINKLEEFSQNVEQNPLDREGSLNKSIDVCNRLDREDFFIFSDGSVSCCDTDFNCNLNIGNVNSQTIQEIYNGEPYRALIRQYKNGRLHENPLCAKCMDFNL